MRLILIFILLSVAALTAQELEEYTLFGMLQTAQLSEISGIERSAQSDTVLWGINDSGNAPNLYAFSKTGVQRSFTIEHAENRDWEDLSAFRRKGQSFLIIADIGDNRAVRDHCVLYIIKEPDLRSSSDEITLQQKIYYQYPDGPRDAEGFAVNPQTRSILICSKRTIPPAIYRLPLDLSSDSLYTAEKIADLTSIPRPKIPRL
ncbi:MAG: hypothetical protein U5R06_12440 [candidate division KSB1 bacterium]|nr:hypothetical protein [candidate division KSB1 bacterium]